MPTSNVNKKVQQYTLIVLFTTVLFKKRHFSVYNFFILITSTYTQHNYNTTSGISL